MLSSYYSRVEFGRDSKAQKASNVYYLEPLQEQFANSYSRRFTCIISILSITYEEVTIITFTLQTRKQKLRDVKEIAQVPWWWNQKSNPDNLIPISVSYPLPYSSCQSPGLTTITHHSSSGAVCFPCLQALLASLCMVGMTRIPGQLIGHYDPQILFYS